MGFQDAVRTCLTKYATFSGRATRREFWWFVLFVVLGGAAFNFLDAAIFGTTAVEVSPGQVVVRSNGPLASIFQLATLLPSLAAAWRRMHDTGRSGLFVLYPLIVMAGIFIFMGFVAGFDNLFYGNFGAIFGGTVGVVLWGATLVLAISPLLVIWWLTRPSQPGTNKYGPNPHEVMT